MIGHDNIIDFSAMSAGGGSPAYAELLVFTKRTARDELHKVMQSMFDNVDDFLFDLADKAENNQQQNLYFDAMRFIRIKKQDMLVTFEREFARLFDEPVRSRKREQSVELFAVKDADTLSLVSDDDLEETLAVQAMVEKAQNLYAETLNALVRRLDHLVNHVEIGQENNPIGPKTICTAFKTAVSLLDLEIGLKLIIYKLFDRYIIENLGPLYDKVNAKLVQEGILPKIKVKPRNLAGNARRGAPAAPAADATGDGEMAGENYYGGDDDLVVGNSFEALQHMLWAQRQTGVPGGASGLMPGGFMPAGVGGVSGGGYGGGATGAGSGSGYQNVLTPDEIIGALSALQHGLLVGGHQPAGALAVASTGGLARLDVSSAIASHMGHIGGESGKSVHGAESDAIDIVAMLFDFILEDPGLPGRLKMSIARLQIPIVKVAILDKDFFTRKNHAARRLINELAYAPSDAEDPILDKVDYVVNRVLMEFEDNLNIFDIVLEEFAGFVAEERERNKRAAEMMEVIKDRVAEEIERRLSAWYMPQPVRGLLLVQWREVLTKIALRDGCEGIAWDKALEVADDVVWSVQPKASASERKRLAQLIPGLLHSLQDGLILISCEGETRARIFNDLEKLHLASMRNDEYRETAAPRKVPTEPEAYTDAELNDVIHQLNTTGSVDSLDEMIESLSAQDGQSPPRMDDFMEDIILQSSQSLVDCSQEIDVLMNSPYVQAVREMEQGTWVEFAQEQGKEKRGKLIWKCELTGEYTFVDRKYKVVADKKFVELVQDFTMGRAFVIEDVPLLDRALDALLNSAGKRTRKDKETAATPAEPPPLS